MSNTRIGVIIGSGVATGVALVYAVKARRKNRSFLTRTLTRTLDKAAFVKQGLKLCGSAATFVEKGREEAERQKKGIVEAVSAGIHAYQRVAG